MGKVEAPMRTIFVVHLGLSTLPSPGRSTKTPCYANLDFLVFDLVAAAGSSLFHSIQTFVELNVGLTL